MLIDCINVKYRNAIEEALSEIDIEVLTYLENIGCSTDVRGTYYFKDMIVSMMERLLKLSLLDGEEYDQFMQEINTTYSQFYFDVARNKHDIGINTFNEYIRQATNISEEENPGLKAYQIALEILQNRGLILEENNIIRKLK